MLSVIIGDIIGSSFQFKDKEEIKKDLINSQDHKMKLFFRENSRIGPISVGLNASIIATKKLLDNIDYHQTIQTKHPDEYSIYFKNNHLEQQHKNIYYSTLKELALKYINYEYNKTFYYWINSEYTVSDSISNEALPRITPIIFMGRSLEESLYLAKQVTSITHTHPKLAETVEQYTKLLYTCKNNTQTTEALKNHIIEQCGNFNITINSLESLEKEVGFHVLAPESLSRAISCFLHANSFEDVVDNCLRTACDTITICIALSFAEWGYGIPLSYYKKMMEYFNYHNWELIKNPIVCYYKNTPESNVINFTDDKKEFYRTYSQIELPDPTAAWDPLEISEEDEYYSEYEKKTREEQKPWWKKILNIN